MKTREEVVISVTQFDHGSYLLDHEMEEVGRMTNELIGDLSKVRLFDLVKPLVDTKKSGMVVIEGAPGGELYLEGGSIIHGKTEAATGEEAIRAIMDLDAGRVRFDWRASPEERTVETSTDQLLSVWGRREEEWKTIRQSIPSSDAVFSIVVDSDGKDRTILERQWGVLALCNGSRSVVDVAGLLGRSIFEVSRAICDLLGMGVLEKAEIIGIPVVPSAKAVDKAFFTTVETELKKVMGPIARVILNDTLAAFEESTETFPKERVESFIRTVCDQIVDEEKREQAGKAMYVAWLASIGNG